jgi:hypothetical protein
VNSVITSSKNGAKVAHGSLHIASRSTAAATLHTYYQAAATKPAADFSNHRSSLSCVNNQQHESRHDPRGISCWLLAAADRKVPKWVMSQ